MSCGAAFLELDVLLRLDAGLRPHSGLASGVSAAASIMPVFAMSGLIETANTHLSLKLGHDTGCMSWYMKTPLLSYVMVWVTLPQEISL